MAKDYDIGQVQPMQGGSYQPLDANVQSPGKSTSMEQLVHAVGSFSEGVRKYSVDQQIEISSEQTTQVLANLTEADSKTQASAAELVRNGQLALGANPYAAKSARHLFMRGIAKRTGDEIAKEYEASPVRNLGPEDVANWTREQFAKKTKSMGFNDPHDMEYLSGFLPVQERAVEGLVGYHNKVAAQRTERDLKEGIAQDAGDVASANLMLPDVAAKDVAENSLRTALMTGMAPRDAYGMVAQGLISKALAEGDTAYLDVAELVPTLNERGESVPLGKRIWAQEDIAKARAQIESQKAQEAKAAANNQKLVLEQNKDAVLAEAGDLLFKGRLPLPAIAEKYETVIRKASQLVTKGTLDPDVVPKLRKLKDEEIESNLKASERGETIGDYGAQAHLEATQLVLNGRVGTLDQALASYSAPAMRPYRKEAFKVWNDWKAAQEAEYRFNLKGMKMGLFNDTKISALKPAVKVSIESQWNGQIAAFEQERTKAGQAIGVGEMNEFASRLADQLIARYTSTPDRDGGKLAPPKGYVESYRDTLISGQQAETARIQDARNAEAAMVEYNKQVDEGVPHHRNEIESLPSKLTAIGLVPYGDEAVDAYEKSLGAIAGMAEASGSPGAKLAANALAELIRTKVTYERQWAATDTIRRGMSDAERDLYQRVMPLMPMPSLPVSVVTKLVQEGAAVVVKHDGGIPGYRKGIYLKNPDKGMSAVLDYVQEELQATRKPTAGGSK